MKLVIGLGNPGEEYRQTRHNLGYLAVEAFCRRRRLRFRGRRCRARIARGRLRGEEILIAEPETYMNLSGEAVGCLVDACAASPSDLVVVCDDAAIALGSLRVRPSGSDGGHRGLRSIHEALGTADFARIRIGIRTAPVAGGDLAQEVLAPFSSEEREIVSRLIEQAADCIDLILEKGVVAAMNRFNRRQPRDPDGPGRGPVR